MNVFQVCERNVFRVCERNVFQNLKAGFPCLLFVQSRSIALHNILRFGMMEELLGGCVILEICIQHFWRKIWIEKTCTLHSSTHSKKHAQKILQAWRIFPRIENILVMFHLIFLLSNVYVEIMFNIVSSQLSFAQIRSINFKTCDQSILKHVLII